MSKPFKHDPQWVKAKRLRRLNQDDIAKAKALGFTPKALMKNIPSPQQKWKRPVKVWICEPYAQKFGARNAPDSKRSRPNSIASGKNQAAAGSKPWPDPWEEENESWETAHEPF